MIEEPLAYGDSFIHQLNPVTKIISTVILSFAAALSNDFTILVVYFIVSLVLVLMARIKFCDVMKRLKPVFWFLLMLWIILPVTFKGEVLYRAGFISITKPGVILCTKITLKSIAILVLFTALLATMTVAALGHGLHKLHVPDKMVFLLLMTYRYISVIEDEYKRLLRAAKFRGFKPGTNLHSYKTYAYLAGMLFVRASCRAQRVYQAMICRGFNGKFNTLDTFSSNRKLNFLFVFVVSALTLTIVLSEYYRGGIMPLSFS